MSLSPDTPAPPVDVAGDGELRASIKTNRGTMLVRLFEKEVPRTVANFVALASGTVEWSDPKGGKTMRPLYSGTIFHRVIPDFMIQGGDPLGTGRGEPGYTFPDEVEQGLPFDRAGLIATANRGPNTNGSQFFITDGPAPHLDGRWTIFGSCDDTEVVSAIARMPRGQMDRPVEPVVLERVTIQR